MQDKYLNKLTAILKILKELDMGEINTFDIAASLGVSVRTVQRYLLDIINAGFPIASNIPGQYSFVEGFSFKSVHTTNTEATMIVFLSEITKNLGKDFEKSFSSIRQKVMCKEIESPFYIKMPKTKGYKRRKEIILIEDAVEQHKIIDINYLNKNGQAKVYRVSPYKIINYEGFWYLYAMKEKEKRTFRLDNIVSCFVTEKTFKPKKSILNKLDESVNIWFELDKKIQVRLLIDKKIAKYFKVKEYFPQQKIVKTSKDGNLTLEAIVGGYDEVSHTIFSWIPFIQVISPQDLRDEIKRKAQTFLSNF